MAKNQWAVDKSAEPGAVLLINDKYATSKDGSINREVAQVLTVSGRKVHSIVLEATEEDRKAAEADGVTLILPTCSDEDTRESCLHWLTFDHVTRYPRLPQDVGYIVGHADITSRAAAAIKEQRFPLARLGLVIGTIPENTEKYKEEEKAMGIGKKEDSIVQDAEKADTVFSVGHCIYDHFINSFRVIPKDKKPTHYLFLPEPAKLFQQATVEYVETREKVILSIGRVNKVERLKGYDLAVKSVAMVAEWSPYVIQYRVCGISKEEYQASMAILQASINSGKLIPTLLPEGTQEDICRHMQQAHLVLMPSRAEPFGLVGLQAMAAGVPVLVSDQSGLAALLEDVIPEFYHSVVLEIKGDDSTDVRRWADQIEKVLRKSKATFKQAEALKRSLLKSRYWEESHQCFLQACGGAAEGMERRTLHQSSEDASHISQAAGNPDLPVYLYLSLEEQLTASVEQPPAEEQQQPPARVPQPRVGEQQQPSARMQLQPPAGMQQLPQREPQPPVGEQQQPSTGLQQPPAGMQQQASTVLHQLPPVAMQQPPARVQQCYGIRILEVESIMFTAEVLNDPVRYRKVHKRFMKHKALLKDAITGSFILLLTFLRQADVDRFYHNHYRVGEGTLSQQLSQILISDELKDRVKGTQLIVRLHVKHEDYVLVRNRLGQGLCRTTSVDRLLALSASRRQVDCSSVRWLDLAVISREDRLCTDRLYDIETLNFTAREVQGVVQIIKEKSQERVKVQLQTMQRQVLTARQGADAMGKEVKRLNERNEKAEKMLLEQKEEMNEKIHQLQETNKNMEAKMEELQSAKHPVESGSQEKDPGKEKVPGKDPAKDPGKEDDPGMERTTSVDNLPALAPPSRQVDHSSLTGLDLAVTSRQGRSCTDRTDDVSALNFTARQVQTAMQAHKEKSQQEVRRLEGEMRAQLLTAKHQTNAMVQSLTQEITRLRKEEQKAQKILLEQEKEIQNLSDANKSKAATIEELTYAKHTAKGVNQGEDAVKEEDTVKKKTQSGPEDEMDSTKKGRKSDETGAEMSLDPGLQLFLAARDGDVEAIKKSLNEAVDVNMRWDGDTALHVSCREGRDKVVELLIKNGADLNVTNQHGDTALHAACAGGHGKVVECLIKNGVDLNVTNVEHKRPIDLAATLDRSTRSLIETGTQKQAEYSELVSSVESEEGAVKLYFCGDGQVGKTSLQTILTKTGALVGVWNIRAKFRRQDVFNPTPGVHVSSKTVKGIGRLILHDFAGQPQFYVTHAMLLRTTNAIFPVVYKITEVEEEIKRQVHGWLSFIHCSNADPTNRPRIVLIASHADKLWDQRAGLRYATALVEHFRQLFKESLVVSQEVFLINCMEAGSPEVRRLRQVLATFRDDILQQRPRVPKVCVQLLAVIEGWRKERKAFPVLEWQDYLAAVRKAMSSLSERIIQLASSYLHDEGEIVYLRHITNSLVVLDYQWLFTFIFGHLLAPDNFPIVRVTRTAEDYVTLEELTRVFSAIANIPLLIKLLQDFQLCYTYDGRTFIIPSLLQQEMEEAAWSPVSSKAVYFGLQIRCRTEIDSFSCDLFPRLQTLLMQAHPDKLSRPLLWKNSAKCTDGKAEALLQITQDKRQLNIIVRTFDGNREDCNYIIDLLTDMTYRLLHETSPGARSRDMVLSTLDLREHRPQPHAYSREEVEAAAAKGENLIHPQRNVPEKVKDLLPHLGNVKGMLGRIALKRPELVETLRRINPILDHLRADDVINLDENDRIRAARTPEDAARKLLDILEAKGERACVKFHSVLKTCDRFAASLLVEEMAVPV